MWAKAKYRNARIPVPPRRVTQITKTANSYLPFSHRATNTVAKSTAGKSDAARPKKLCLKIGVSKTNKGGRQAKIALPRRGKSQPIQKSNTAKIPIKSKWATKRPDSSNAKTKGI